MSSVPQPVSVGVRRGFFGVLRLWWSRSCVLLLLFLLYLILDFIWIKRLGVSLFIVAYGTSIVVMSGVTFILYWIDKRRAVRGSNRRIPESTLHVCGLMGGWPGGIIAQELFHHKTLKVSFRVMFLVTALVHGIGITWLMWELSQKFSSRTAELPRHSVHQQLKTVSLSAEGARHVV